MKKPKGFRCGWCDADSNTAEAALAHIVETGHCVGEKVWERLKTSEELRAEFLGILQKLLCSPLGTVGEVVSQEEYDQLEREGKLPPPEGATRH